MKLTYKLSKNNIELFLIYCIALTGPMVFLSFRPFLNFFLVDFFIIIYFIFFIFTLRSRSVKLSLITSIFLIIIGYTLSGVFTEYPEYYFPSTSQYLLVFLLLIAMSTAKIPNLNIEKIIGIYILGMSISILVSYLIYFNILTLFESNYYVAGRFKGVWGNPNSLAKEMIMYITVLLSVISLSKIPFRKAFLYISLSLAAFYLILTTASFGGLLFLIVAMLLLILILIVKSNSKQVLKYFVYTTSFFTLIVTLLIFYKDLVIQLIPERFSTRILEADSISNAGSGANKIEHIIEGLKIFSSHPLVGTGIESGKHYNNTVDLISGIPIGFHSFYITVMVEGGVLAILGFLGVFIYFIKSAFQHLNNYKYIFIVITLVFLSNLIINNNIFSRYVWFPVVFVVLNTSLNKTKNIPDIN